VVFTLEPGFQLVLDDNNERLVITVADETKKVNGVITRVIEEKAWETKGELT
jgi:hypothetical protein